jgi:hypothetical protein
LRWIAGESAYSIAKDLPVSKTAILKRVKRDGWTREANGIVSEKHRGGFPDLGQDCPANRQRVIERLASGFNYDVAAMAIGVTTDQLRSWRRADPDFERQCRAAKSQPLGKAQMTMARESERDWKAANAVLRSAEETRDQYAPNAGGGPKLEVVININRGGDAPRGVIVEQQRPALEHGE